MFLEHREKEENKRQATAGYDLTDAYAQISYCLPGEPCPKTISLQADQEQYLIPALLGRYTDQDLWVYGPKAQAAAAAGEVFLVDGLLTKAAHQEMVEVGGQNYSSVALLSLFLKRTMSLLAPIVRPERLQALVFSVPEVSVPILSAVTDAVGMLGLKNASLFLIGRAESFFYYNICQPEELWKQDVLLCDFSGTFLHTLLFTANRKTSPVACFVEEADWKEVAAGREDLDQCFLETMKALIGDRNVSCVYLIGEGFLGEWYQESLRFLCQERRVFLGNNLYSKGACYAARQRMTPGSVSEGYVFLGKDMLKANISLYAEKRGQDSCQPLLDAGTNWYDAKAEIDFLLEEENRFSLRITPLNGGEIRDVEIALTGLPQRPVRTTRIHLQIDMADLTTLRLNMEDFGFGEFFPATHQFWEKTISIGQPDTAAGSSTAAQASAGADTTDTATVASEQSAAGADAKSAAPPVLAES